MEFEPLLPDDESPLNGVPMRLECGAPGSLWVGTGHFDLEA